MKRIIICGPESTGKSKLVEDLANYYSTNWVAEYAREYILRLNREYNYHDIEKIARKQIEEIKEIDSINNNLVFFDTGLIITKIWFLEVYSKYPNWLDEAIREYSPDFYLLCYYDLPWKPHKVRENGSNERRKHLFNKYLEEIERNRYKYQIIKGFDQERLKIAISAIEKHIFCDDKK